MLAPDLHIVIGDLYAELIGRKMLDVQVDCELVSVRPHLRKTKKHTHVHPTHTQTNPHTHTHTQRHHTNKQK